MILIQKLINKRSRYGKLGKRSDSQNKIFGKSLQAICPSFDGNNDVEQYIKQAKINLSQIAPITESEAEKTLISQISGDERKVIKGYLREQIKKKKYIFKILNRELKKKDKAQSRTRFWTRS